MGGTVAFVATLDGGGSGIFTGGNGGPTSTVANGDGPFRDFGGAPSINASGTVAFLTSLDDGRVGIFTGGDPVADKVIANGDALFGSTVVSLSFSRGLNDDGSVAFNYFLANGVSGVAIAVVPEPAGLALLGVAGLGLLRRRRR